MKTINNKKTAVTIFIVSLFLTLFITPSINAEERDYCITEEVDEQELEIEPWMTSVEEFNKLKDELREQSQMLYLEECAEEPIPVEPWMFDVSYFSRTKISVIESKKLVALVTDTTNDLQTKML
jgi:hypothetical protein